MFKGNALFFKLFQHFAAKANLGVHHVFFNIDSYKAFFTCNTSNGIDRFVAGTCHDHGSFIFRLVGITDVKMAYIEMINSCKTYHMGGSTIYANRDVSFSVEKGELAIILGSSGAGKSTVLNILGGMDSNDSGKVIIDGKDISKYSRTQLTAYRRTDVGFVFQFYNLVQNLTAKENVELASEIVEHALDPVTVLKDVGLADRINNFPAQLSGGEQQRVAIARAIAKNPKILLCDEPTGALDYNTGKQVLQILQDMSRQKGATVIIVTHNAAIAPIADRVIHMHDARVSRIEENPNPKKIADIEW